MNLSFRLGGIPVRVEPSFFVVTLVLNIGLVGADLARLALWTAIVFGSVLVHELGHAIVGLAFGLKPRIDLHGFGGTTSWSTAPHADASAGSAPSPLSPAKGIAISLAGPGMGFVAGAAVAACAIAFGPGAAFVAGALGSPIGLAPPVASVSLADFAYEQLLFVNVGWGILNLLPMLPLDGGNVVAQVFALARRGERPARMLSLGVAVLATAAALLARQIWPALIAASFVATNWRALKDAAARARDRASLAELEKAYAALEARDGARVIALVRPIALGASTPSVRAEALQLLAFGFLLEGRVADADAAVAAMPAGFTPHPRFAEERARAAEKDRG